MKPDRVRRQLIKGVLGSSLIACTRLPMAGAQGIAGERLPSWKPGMLDIHHIATGRGNATFVLMPDGTSFLLDAGASNNSLDVSFSPRPGNARRPGEWIGRYVQRHLRTADRSVLDYLMISHFHPDHTGDVSDASPMSGKGHYRLSGVTDVAEIVPVDTVVDRGFPDYDYPVVWKAQFATNYFSFIKDRVSKGQRVERFKVGSDTQFHPRGHKAFKGTFGIRNLVANGEVWIGRGNETRSMFPPLQSLASDDYPTENMCSAGIRLSYGDFSYFTCGDLTSYTWDGEQPWRDVLTAAARAAGPVDVATADHHGLFDGLSADTVRVLRPQAWVIPTWHISQPDLLQLERMFSERLYPGPRDVFATAVMKENILANHRLASRMRSTDGHVIVRVMPDGVFNVFVTDSTDEQDRIKLVTGPYQSKAKSVI